MLDRKSMIVITEKQQKALIQARATLQMMVAEGVVEYVDFSLIDSAIADADEFLDKTRDAELSGEFDAWDKLSDEAFLNFQKHLDSTAGPENI